MRKKIIAGNWKMNKKIGEAASLASQMATWAAKYSDSVDIVVCPTFTALSHVSQALKSSSIKTGAQDCYYQAQGAYTGEINPELLKDAGAAYCIVGHSERRTLLDETDKQVNLKVKALIKEGVMPIICVGETLEERNAKDTINVVSGQLIRAFAGVTGEDAKAYCVVAYEPVWAIGTGLNATAGDAQDVCCALRKALAFLYGGEVAESVRIQYGGSVKADNIASFMSMPDIDGALVGGASLKPEDFEKIVGAASLGA